MRRFLSSGAGRFLEKKVTGGAWMDTYPVLLILKNIEEALMTAVKAYYDGKAFVPVSPVKAAKNQAAIVTVLDDAIRAYMGGPSGLQ
jgi:hypothetical protein